MVSAQAADRHRSLVAERGRDAGLERGRRGMADGPRREAGSARRAGIGAPRRRADDRRELGPGRGDRAQQPPALADDLADRPGADRGQLAAEVLGDGQEEALDHLGRAGELGPQVLALGGDARSGQVSRWHWRAMSQPTATSAAVPNANSSAPSSAAIEQVATGLQAAVGAQRDPVAQVVAQQDLVDLGEAELPRRADVLDRATAATRPVPPAWPDRWMYVAPALATPGGDRADAAAGDELHADPRRRVDRAQVGDELGEVLDRVDVVVRRRADVALAGLAAAERGDVGRRLAPGQLAALAGLGALRDLDLELVGPGEVRRRSRRTGPMRPA